MGINAVGKVAKWDQSVWIWERFTHEIQWVFSPKWQLWSRRQRRSDTVVGRNISTEFNRKHLEAKVNSRPWGPRHLQALISDNWGNVQSEKWNSFLQQVGSVGSNLLHVLQDTGIQLKQWTSSLVHELHDWLDKVVDQIWTNVLYPSADFIEWWVNSAVERTMPLIQSIGSSMKTSFDQTKVWVGDTFNRLKKWLKHTIWSWQPKRKKNMTLAEAQAEMQRNYRDRTKTAA